MLQVYIDAKPLGPSKLFSLLYLTRNRIPSILFKKKKKISPTEAKKVGNTEHSVKAINSVIMQGKLET